MKSDAGDFHENLSGKTAPLVKIGQKDEGPTKSHLHRIALFVLNE
jgi:hypothetical protein